MSSPKKQTALQELIDWVETNLILEGCEYAEITGKFKSFLIKEREQIEDAYWGGINGTMSDWSEAKLIGGTMTGIKPGEGAKQYFNETYITQ